MKRLWVAFREWVQPTYVREAADEQPEKPPLMVTQEQEVKDWAAKQRDRQQRELDMMQTELDYVLREREPRRVHHKP